MGWCNEHGSYQDQTTVGCPHPVHTFTTPTFGYTVPDRRVPFKCPCCDGMGKRLRPPYVAGDQDSWVASGTGLYDCSACHGTGIVWAKEGE